MTEKEGDWTQMIDPGNFIIYPYYYYRFEGKLMKRSYQTFSNLKAILNDHFSRLGF